MWKTVLFAAFTYFVVGFLLVLLVDAIGVWDKSPLEVALVLAPIGAVITAMQERRSRDE